MAIQLDVATFSSDPTDNMAIQLDVATFSSDPTDKMANSKKDNMAKRRTHHTLNFTSRWEIFKIYETMSKKV
jgi:hypothetical protein